MLNAPAAERNKQPIADVLKDYLHGNLKLLEIASGTGQHLAHLAPLFPHTIFQPSECDHRSLHSIVAYVDHHRFPNLRVPLFVDATKPVHCWALPEDFAPHDVDITYNANMIHISSNAAVNGLFQAAGCLLRYGSGLLITYGPYAMDGIISPKSNIDFDRTLRAQNPEWGLRDVAELKQIALQHGLHLHKIHDMPANNKILVFKKEDGGVH